MKIYLLGHKAPDLDSVSGPVGYAEFLKKVKRYEDAELVPAVCEEVNKETEVIFSKFGIPLPQKISNSDLQDEDRVILIDHNEVDQRMPGLEDDKVIEIVDHHKIKVNFTSPIRIDVRPHGSVSSVIYENYLKEGVEPSKPVAGLFLASILSDTQGLKSSTTTGWDIKSAEELAQQTGTNIESLTFEIFKAKSDITGLSAEEIIRKDYKIFDFGGRKVFIGQVETVEPEKVLSMVDKLLPAIEEVKAQEDVGLLFLAITDILKVNSKIIYSTEEEQKIAEEAFDGVGENSIINIGPRMSRKKDIAPEIEKVLAEDTT